jgi:hypothetical protein
MKNLLYILLILPLFFIASCEEKDETQSGYDGANLNLEIGDVYEGGIIFYG